MGKETGSSTEQASSKGSGPTSGTHRATTIPIHLSPKLNHREFDSLCYDIGLAAVFN